MALIAEQLVEEWLNRKGFLTVRGYRKGVDEIDLLGVCKEKGQVTGVHCEVQVSIRPIGYIAPLTKVGMEKMGVGARSAKQRPSLISRLAVDAWVQKKFTSPKKTQMRDGWWPGMKWQMMFIHGKIRHEEELEFIRKKGIETFHIADVSQEVQKLGTAGLGADIASLFEVCSRR